MARRNWTILRHIVQVAIIALIASPLTGSTFFQGNLAAADLFGLPLADPLAFLQAVLGGHVMVVSFAVAALLILAFYFVLGGRTFCGWVCPVGLLTELGDIIRQRLGTGHNTIPLATSRWVLLLVLALTALTGIPLFELVSPIGITGRAVMFGDYLPLILVAGILIIEIFVARRIWCRSLCPLGGLYSLLGRWSPTRVSFAANACTHCNECLAVCPVEEVLAPPLEQSAAQVVSGDCTRCMACVDICPTKALSVSVRYRT